MTMRKCSYHPYIDAYMDDIRNGIIPSSEEIKLAMDYIEFKLDNPDVVIDNEKIDKAVELTEKYFEFKLLDWELFLFALIHCYYKSNDTVVFDEYFIMMGRGNGKNGFISPVAWYLTTHYHGIKGYNVDIIANSQDQAETSFNDIYDVLEKFWTKLKKFFHKTKEIITNVKTKSYIKFNTSNARTKDGKRSACLIFDEIHEYENYSIISVFTSGFGKKKHSRAFYITTNGHVREGVLDDKLAMAKDVLNGTIKDLGMLPLIYKIDCEEDALNPEMWHKANPSLRFFPELKKEMDKEFISMKYQPHMEQEFFTKRLNWPKGNKELQVTEWDNIIATNKPIPDLSGLSAVVGVDYTKVTDFASVDLHFRDGDRRYDISHSWLCLKSADIPRLKIPWQQWEAEGLLTSVDDVEISPDLIAEWISEQAKKYNLIELALDNYRYALLANSLKKVGFDANEFKNVRLVRPSDIMKVVPIIDSCFANQYFVWGNNPLLRWATNNTKLIPSGKKQGTDTGNYYYGKIEAKSRKTDPFMALVAAMTIEDKLGDGSSLETPDVDVYTY
ncbi:terminase large subunit domain-containing protein [Clostridium sp. BSD9I1]|uniref:terminase large subunit domain-containing protein n=1 Tax=Clostridium sp. BSD9I1 TaxID=2003589 RepID=UPI001FA91582|nr:terminase large subunit [Clostridium sp. BSD9I1]